MIVTEREHQLLRLCHEGIPLTPQPNSNFTVQEWIVLQGADSREQSPWEPMASDAGKPLTHAKHWHPCNHKP